MRICGYPLCGRRIAHGSRCALHPYRWRSGSTRAWRKQRARIILRDNGRCAHVDASGERCTAVSLLEVHHLVGGSVVNVPDHMLITVCRRHHPRTSGY